MGHPAVGEDNRCSGTFAQHIHNDKLGLFSFKLHKIDNVSQSDTTVDYCTCRVGLKLDWIRECPIS